MGAGASPEQTAGDANTVPDTAFDGDPVTPAYPKQAGAHGSISSTSALPGGRPAAPTRVSGWKQAA